MKKAKNKQAKAVKIPRVAKNRLDALDAAIDATESLSFSMAANEYNYTGMSGRSALSLASDTSKSAHVNIIKECSEIYRTTGIVKNIIDLMADFAVEGIDIVHEVPEQENFYKSWTRIIRLQNRAEHIIRSYFKQGNVPILGHHAEIENKLFKLMTRPGAETSHQAEGGINTFNPEVERKTIPIKYTILNPTNLTKDGIAGYKVVKMKIDKKIADLVKKDKRDLSESEALALEHLDKDIIKQIKKSKLAGSNDLEVIIGTEEDDLKLTILHYKKDDWQDWADPLIFATLDDIKFKKLLRAADEQAARNIINAVTIFKVGSTKDKLPATEQQFKKLNRLLKTPTNTKTIVWNDLIDVTTHYAPVEKILGADKYESVNNDILSGFGVSQVIVNGGGGNYSNSYLSVKTLLERLETAREELIMWLYKEIRIIMKAFKWDIEPKIRFGQMNLRNEAAEKQIMMNLVDRNIISAETMLEYLGEDFNVELSRINRNQTRQDLVGVEQNSPIKTKDQINPNTKTVTPRGKDQVGRPKNIETDQKTQRDTKPKGIGEIFLMKDSVAKLYEATETIVIDEFCKVKNVPNKKSLVKEDREALDDIIFKVFSNLSVDSTRDTIHDLLKNKESLVVDKCTSEIFESLKQNKGTASLQDVRDMRVNAFVMAQLEGIVNEA